MQRILSHVLAAVMLSGVPTSAQEIDVTKILLNAGAGATIRDGSGTPEGSVTAPVGSTYHDRTNGALYLKVTGAGNTGWLAILHTSSALPAANLTGTIASAVQDNITRTGTLVSGATGAGYTLAIGTSTITGVSCPVIGRRPDSRAHVTRAIVPCPQAVE